MYTQPDSPLFKKENECFIWYSHKVESEQVKWIRVLYEDFSTFARDQERLISAENTFDYIEGLVIKNRTGVLNNWRASFNPQDSVQASQFNSDGKTLFCLELATHFNPENVETTNQVRLATTR